VASTFTIIALSGGYISLLFFICFLFNEKKIHSGSHKMFSQRKKGMKSQL